MAVVRTAQQGGACCPCRALGADFTGCPCACHEPVEEVVARPEMSVREVRILIRALERSAARLNRLADERPQHAARLARDIAELGLIIGDLKGLLAEEQAEARGGNP
jgi:hypothetical protein